MVHKCTLQSCNEENFALVRRYQRFGFEVVWVEKSDHTDSASNNALASCKSFVSNPSVNQP